MTKTIDSLFGDKKMRKEYGKTEAGVGAVGKIEIVFIQEVY